jgi:LysR family transcriptional activator of nhaA
VNINYQHLFYFWKVAKEGNLTNAAKKLHTSQSAISIQIKKLEDRIGVDLFTRQGRVLQLTSEGKIALDYAEKIFNTGKELLDVLVESPLAYQKTLRIGASSNLSRNFQEAFIKPLFSKKDVRLILQSGRLEDMLELLATHQLDILLTNTPMASYKTYNLSSREIAKQIISIIGKPSGKDKKSFTIPNDLCNYPLLLPSSNSEFRVQFDMLCDDWQIEPQIIAEVDDMAMLRLLTRDIPESIALMPKVVVKDELQSGTLIEYCQLPNLYEHFYAIYHKGQYVNPLYQEILNLKLTI